MKCDKCGCDIAEGEEVIFHGRTLCEDCGMDAMSPARTCDPWAVRSASLTSGHDGSKTTPVQDRILSLISERGEMGLVEIAEALDMKTADVEREIAALRHMEKVRGALVEGKKVFRPW